MICEICGKRFSSEKSLRAHRKLAKSCAPRDLSHAERRAEETALQLIAEGEDPRAARAFGRCAYGLDNRAPKRDPRFSSGMRRAMLEDAATSRRSERLPSVEGRTSGSAGARR